MREASPLSIGFQIQPQPCMVSIVRRFVEKSCAELVGDPEAEFRISLAVHELLENAAKYAVGNQTGLSVQCDANGCATRIRLTNQSTPEHIARLRASIEEIQSSREPSSLYQRLMRKTAGIREESGLGLARIRVEGDLDLSLEVDRLMVTITASRPSVRAQAYE
jgi:anti-sigma regulatory factor (Ser/Thr protein kinase)